MLAGPILALALALAAGEPAIVAHVREYAASTEPAVLERDVMAMARAHAAKAGLDPAATEREVLAAVLAIKSGRPPDPAVLPLLEKVLQSAEAPAN